MATEQILQMLIAERDRLNVAIEALGGGTTTKRRGRPPKDQSLANAPAWVTGNKPERKKHSRVFTVAQRKQQALRMKKYWAAKKRAAKGAKTS